MNREELEHQIAKLLHEHTERDDMKVVLSINASELRKAFQDMSLAEAHGFMFCLAVFKLSLAGQGVAGKQAVYDGLLEKAHPTDPNLNWGRGQEVSKHCKFENDKLIRISDGQELE